MTFSSPPHPNPVTFVILNWRRKQNVRNIVAQMIAFPWVDEVLIWDNANDFTFTEVCKLHEKVEVIPSPENIVTWGRFMAAKMAKNEIVATQDDDFDVRNWPAIRERFLSHRSRIVHALDPWHFENEANKAPFALLGWGSMFLRDWVNVFDVWVHAHGEKDLLHRKADRIFGVLCGGPRFFDPMRAEGEILPGATGEESLHFRPDHGRLTSESVKAATKLFDMRQADLFNLRNQRV